MTFIAAFLYHFKTNVIRYICFLLSFICFFAGFYFAFEKSVININDYRVYSSSSMDEIWSAHVGTDKECFYNFNGTVFVVSGDKALNADVLMQSDGVTYEDNLFQLEHILNPNECAVSKNTALTYKLNVGDDLVVGDDELVYKISYIFDSIKGVDQKYNHEGVVVLAYDRETTESYLYTYLFFAKSGGSYLSTISVVNIENIREEKMKNLVLSMSLLVGVISITIVVEDLLIFRHKEKEYEIRYGEGCGKLRLVGHILIDNLLRGFVPLLILSLIYIKYLPMFTYGYVFVVSNILSAALLFVIISTAVYYYRRISYVKIR